MTDIQPDNATTDEATGNIEAAPFSVGTALREARVHLGLSVDEVSNRVKFAPRQIEALEADDFAHLPETAFLRGFVRSYARSLQLDPAPLLAALPHAPEQSMPLEEKALTEVPYPDIYTERKQNIIWLAAALAVAVILALSAWLLGDKQKEQKAAETTLSSAQNATVETLALPDTLPVSAVPDAEPVTVTHGSEKPGAEKLDAEMKKTAEVKIAPQISPPSAQLVQPVAVPLAKPAAANNALGQAAIRMTFDADSWVEITDKNGKLLLSQLNHAGTEQGINGSPPFSLVIGHAKTVHLYYKGQAVDLAPHTQIEVARLTLE
jgi:cytoskeleton protein RodZ